MKVALIFLVLYYVGLFVYDKKNKKEGKSSYSRYNPIKYIVFGMVCTIGILLVKDFMPVLTDNVPGSFDNTLTVFFIVFLICRMIHTVMLMIRKYY